MPTSATLIGVFATRPAAEAAVKRLSGAGFDLKHLTLVGRGFQSDEKVLGFYNAAGRIEFWGTRGPFWGLDTVGTQKTPALA